SRALTAHMPCAQGRTFGPCGRFNLLSKNANAARRLFKRGKRGRRGTSVGLVSRRVSCGNCWRCLLCASADGRLGIDADELAVPSLVLELYDAVNEREQRVVLAAPDVLARLPFRAALPRENVPAQHTLAAKLLQAQTLRMRITPVPR